MWNEKEKFETIYNFFKVSLIKFPSFSNFKKEERNKAHNAHCVFIKSEVKKTVQCKRNEGNLFVRNFSFQNGKCQILEESLTKWKRNFSNRKEVKQWGIRHRNVRRGENAGAYPTRRPLKGKGALGRVNSFEKLLLSETVFALKPFSLRRKIFILELFWFELYSASTRFDSWEFYPRVVCGFFWSN